MSNRSAYYQGPGYNLPTGTGKYNITGWGMQKDVASIGGSVAGPAAVRDQHQPGLLPHRSADNGFSLPMNQGVWTMFSATIDTAMTPSGVDCLPTGAAPGVVRAATLYLNQYDDMSGRRSPRCISTTSS